eukprot:s923_g3.t1
MSSLRGAHHVGDYDHLNFWVCKSRQNYLAVRLELGPQALQAQQGRSEAGQTFRMPDLVADATAEADLSAVNWDTKEVRCRHGVCFEVIDPSVSERLPFVSTQPAAQVMRQLLLAIGVGSPVLLSGPSAGKTTFIRRAAELMGQHEPVFLFCDEQTDIKMLLGAYVCGETVGEFVWRPGVVTQALQLGRWLVLEDVDRVPAEVLAALLPLSASRRLVIPERNQCIDAHKDFHLFGTLSSGQPVLWSESTAAESEVAEGAEGRVQIGSNFHSAGSIGRVPPLVSAWTRVQIAPLLQTHLAELVNGLYPELSSLTTRLLESAAVLQHLAGQLGPALGAGPATGPRDILRWCARLRKAQLVLSPIFTEDGRAVLLREALQVLLGRVADLRQRRSFLACLAPVWSLGTGVAEALLQERPTVTFLPSATEARQVQIGEVTLLLMAGGDPGAECE